MGQNVYWASKLKTEQSNVEIDLNANTSKIVS